MSPRRQSGEAATFHYVLGQLSGGFRIVASKALILSSGELFNRHDVVRGSVRTFAGRAIDSFLELREGDLVVHLAHGIGRYRGMKLIEKEGAGEEHLEIEFDGGTRIYVPATKIELVQKYVGGKKTKPTLAKIGGKSWVRQKQAAQEAVSDLASDMLELQAKRDGRPGIRFPEDTQWQCEFDASFPYDETPDQLTAIDAIKADMQLHEADGPVVVRRCGLRQNGGCHSRRVQSGRCGLPGGRAGADHRAGRAAPPDVHARGWRNSRFKSRVSAASARRKKNARFWSGLNRAESTS